MEDNLKEMNIENLKQKVENQAKIIRELTKENEVLFHQYNHLIIRNGKLLKRIDDFQRIIDDLHIRNEEFQLINGNLTQINDSLRRRTKGDEMEMANLDSDERVQSIQESEFDVEKLCNQWKNYPGQVAQNAPNLRKQIVMLLNLYRVPALRAEDLFRRSGVGGVTGARYVSSLKKVEFIRYTGARKKGQYEITSKGRIFIESSTGLQKK